MKDKLQDLENEIFGKYPDWTDKLKFKDYLSGVIYGKGSPYAIVETPFALHRVSVRNLLKGNYPTIKTAIDQNEYAKNYNAHMIKILGDEFFLLKPEWENKLELIQYLPGKNHVIGDNKIIDGGPFLRVRTEIGIHIIPVSRLRQGYFPSLNSTIEVFDDEVMEINYTDPKMSKNYTVVTRFKDLSEITEYVNITQIEEDKINLIKKTKIWFLVKDLRNDEYFYQRKISIKSNSKPSIKNALNEISLLNKITPNDKRKFQIKVIQRYGKTRDELAYLIEWCGCQFVKEQSWILDEIGHVPSRLLGSILSLTETANKVFQYQNSEMAVLFNIKRYLPNNKSARVLLSDQDGIEYDFRWSDILDGKTPGLRSAINMEDHVYREMREKNFILRNDIQILGFAETKGKSNARLIKVIYKPYNTEHIVYYSVLKSGKKLTVVSAIDKLGFLNTKVKVDFPELYRKIEIIKIVEIIKETKRNKCEKESQVLIRVLKSGEQHLIPLTYLQNNRYLRAVLGEWTHIPIHAIIKIDPSKLLNVYFIQMIHTSGIRTYKIGWTLYDTPAQRVKTMGNGWVLHNYICFDQQTAIDIYEFERDYKMISLPEIPKEYRPNNGFTEFIWHEILAEKWGMLSKVKMTFEEVKDFLKNISQN